MTNTINATCTRRMRGSLDVLDTVGVINLDTISWSFRNKAGIVAHQKLETSKISKSEKPQSPLHN